MRTKIKLRYLALVLIFVVIVYLFWGPLFPWNPVKIGYTKIDSPKATIYIKNISHKDSVVYRIGEIIRAEEKFHDLRYQDHFKIIILDTQENNK